MKALIHDCRICELHPTGFPVHESMQWVDAPDGVTDKWTYENGVFIPPVVSQQETIDKLTGAVQRHLDLTAKVRGYDGILSACTYATSTIARFAADGQACVRWRDLVWATCYAHMDTVLAGNAPIPTSEELIAMLPAMVWPT